jgi:hypothetical protein
MVTCAPPLPSMRNAPLGKSVKTSAFQRRQVPALRSADSTVIIAHSLPVLAAESFESSKHHGRCYSLPTLAKQERTNDRFCSVCPYIPRIKSTE